MKSAKEYMMALLELGLNPDFVDGESFKNVLDSCDEMLKDPLMGDLTWRISVLGAGGLEKIKKMDDEERRKKLTNVTAAVMTAMALGILIAEKAAEKKEVH